MRLLRADDVLGRAPDFSLSTAGERCYFVHSNGQRVQTDKVGKIIWESLPGRAEEVIRKSRSLLSAGADAGNSPKAKAAAGEGRRGNSPFLEEYIYVLFKAGIIRSDFAESRLASSSLRPSPSRAAKDASFAAGPDAASRGHPGIG